MAVAYAHTNIALVKYWGKRSGDDAALNLPATGSLSVTLDKFGTHTRVERAERDAFVLDGKEIVGPDAERVFRFLDLVHASRPRARVTSRNDVPTAAGLASSASGFAALALAAAREFGSTFDDKALTQLARRGSGSAARSIHGGFVILHRGARDDGADCYAERADAALDVRVVVVKCGSGRKLVGSRAGMEHSAKTSPMYSAWVDTHAQDLADARAALAAGDLPKLGEITEHNTLKMHATTFSARPPFWYWTPSTLAVLGEVRAARDAGVPGWATMDAGPHVKILCAPEHADAMKLRLLAVEGVVGVEICAPGPAARVVADEPAP